LKARYDAVFEVDFHVGELYFLIPILYCLEYSANQRICLLFYNKEIRCQMLRDKVLSAAIREIPCDIMVVPHSGVFDFVSSQYKKKKGKALKILFRVVKKISIAEASRRKMLEMIHRSGQAFCQITGKGLVAHAAVARGSELTVTNFPHTSGAYLIKNEKVVDASDKLQRKAKSSATILAIDMNGENYWRCLGYERIVPVGYFSATSKWISLLKSLSGDPKPTIVIYSYQQRDDLLPKEQWEQLHQSTYEAVRDLCGDIRIIIKPHPNQDLKHLRGFIKKNNWKNYTLTLDNPMLIAANAVLAVSFLTSGIYNSLLQRIPSINYYNAKDVYIRKRGSYFVEYSEYGIPEAENQDELRRFIGRVIHGEYTTDFVERLVTMPTMKSFDDLLVSCMKK
jgi:hypothetical protein